MQPFGEPSSTASSALRGLRGNVIAGVRLAFFRRVRAEDIEASWSQFVWLVLLDLAIVFVADFASVGTKGRFVFYSLPELFYYVPVTVVAAWGIGMIARQPERISVLAVALLALTLPMEIVGALWKVAQSHGFAWLQPLGFATYQAPLLWLVLAAAAGAIRMFAVRPAMRVPVLLAAAILLGLPQVFSWRGSIWTQPYDEDATRSRYMALAGEDAFYRQPKLLERALARLLPGRKGVVDLYFVGVAGYASQDVFMKELNSVSKLFRERFDAEGRTVRLVNNAKTVNELPVASVTALRVTLARIAQLMDPEEDILFLYLTSHGSKEHRFSLEFWPLQFNPLDPAVLRKLLDDSGIKRRVIVVSACYSGGFIEPLRNADSLVITAASPDRNSFGCSNENDFTYFGKAYFDEALRGTYSFVEAFEKAKPKIAAREKKQDYEGSEPQIFVGEGIKPALAALEARLENPGVAAAPAPPPDKYARFADLWVRPETLRLYREQCERGVAQISPDANIEKYPNYYEGIDRRSKFWPRIVAAWSTYVEEYCAAASDERTFRRAYAELWSRDLAERDLEAAEKFLATEPGRRFLGASNDVAVGVTRKVVEASAVRTEAAVRRYRDEMARIGAEYRGEAKVVGK